MLESIITGLENYADNTVAFFESLTEEELDTQIYEDGAKWTAKQILAHFITVERSVHWLITNISEGGDGAPKDFDLDRFNQSQTSKLDNLSFNELIQQFKNERIKTIFMVTKLTLENLDLHGQHAFLGYGRLAQFLEWIYEHNSIHENEIGETLEIKGKM